VQTSCWRSPSGLARNFGCERRGLQIATDLRTVRRACWRISFMYQAVS